MNFPFQRVLVPLGLSALVVVAWQAQGWAGVALVGGGLVMWGLLHVTRLMTVLKRASDRPKGYVDSAVMLNAKLRTGVNLLHVMALTRSLGELQSAEGASPEVFRWADSGGSEVTCTFVNGRLTQWALQRPAVDAGTEAPAPTPAA
jgi:hypothetical protein